MRIEALNLNDLVWSRDEQTGETQLKPIAQTFERYSATLALTFDNGETIETTSEHPFYVVGRGFVKAGELGIGSSIVTRAGPSVQLVSSVAGKAQAVYNFEVADYHSYFAGQGEVWVHNADYSGKTPDEIANLAYNPENLTKHGKEWRREGLDTADKVKQKVRDVVNYARGNPSECIISRTRGGNTKTAHFMPTGPLNPDGTIPDDCPGWMVVIDPQNSFKPATLYGQGGSRPATFSFFKNSL